MLATALHRVAGTTITTELPISTLALSVALGDKGNVKSGNFRSCTGKHNQILSDPTDYRVRVINLRSPDSISTEQLFINIL